MCLLRKDFLTLLQRAKILFKHHSRHFILLFPRTQKGFHKFVLATERGLSSLPFLKNNVILKFEFGGRVRSSLRTYPPRIFPFSAYHFTNPRQRNGIVSVQDLCARLTDLHSAKISPPEPQFSNLFFIIIGPQNKYVITTRVFPLKNGGLAYFNRCLHLSPSNTPVFLPCELGGVFQTGRI